MLRATSLLFSLWCTLVSSSVSTASSPTTGEDWISLSQETSFQPTNSQDPRLVRARQRFLNDGITNSALPVDSIETEWDGYQQAWRLVGFYVDCSVGGQQQDHRRSLNQQQQQGAEQSCQRYLLWAAYVDLSYQGGGLGEYQIWNRDNRQWDRTACQVNGNGRCAKMDCHLPDTHWELLGYFKEESYSEEFFEQLFKHQGYCLWDEDEYEFMQENYRWPEECQQTNTQVDGQYLYYDLKPMPGANMTVGLYTDSRCRYEFVHEEITAQSVVQDMEVLQYIDQWNYGLEVYKTCQPCRAYSLQGQNGRQRRRTENGGNNNANNGYFTCNDAAGYTDVNQCMKFRTKTTMQQAFYRDVMATKLQGSAINVEFRSEPPRGLRTTAWIVFWVGALALLMAWFMPAKELASLREPFVVSSKGVEA